LQQMSRDVLLPEWDVDWRPAPQPEYVPFTGVDTKMRIPSVDIE
jgi:hypothetical protein